MVSKDSFGVFSELEVGGREYRYFSLPKAEESGLKGISHLPFSLKVLLENLLRNEDGKIVTTEDILAVAGWGKKYPQKREIAFRPGRVLMQDYTGVPAVVDLAAMRDAVVAAGGDPSVVNPRVPIDLVIDHSVTVERYASPDAFKENVRIEVARNRERYTFLRWGQRNFDNFRVVPPGTGICHQVNLEYLGKVVWNVEHDDGIMLFPDTLVGMDSHTPMINGMGVLGWGVGGIEAEAVALGEPIYMLLPEVIGVRLVGKLGEAATATDIVLTITEMLRDYGVVGRFVEFFGPGLDGLTVADRATISNMSPEFGATCGFFPVDEQTIEYLKLTGRDKCHIELVETYAKAQGMWREKGETSVPDFTDVLELDLSSVRPSLAGPFRPNAHVYVPGLWEAQKKTLPDVELDKSAEVRGRDFRLRHGDIVIAAITSCTNTSNPAVLLGAGLLAKKAVERGLSRKPWVKTSLAPGSKVVTDYYKKTGLSIYLEKLGFYLVGYGCTTCIGNSGPLDKEIREAIEKEKLDVAAVLSGNRNFSGRINPHVRSSWLASPMLVVAYAIAGTTRVNLESDPLGRDSEGKAVYLRDIWPSRVEIQEAIQTVSVGMFEKEYARVFEGNEKWRSLPVTSENTYAWVTASTYVKHPPFFEKLPNPTKHWEGIAEARVLALFGDGVTTDHISPAGDIAPGSPAASYLTANGVDVTDFNSYGTRRGNHEVMIRGTFANVRIRNEMVQGIEGGMTRHFPEGELMNIYAAAMQYTQEGVPLVVIAGKEYGTGSSRDWAAKGTKLLGVRAVIAESFERIHRSNLVGMGVMPLQFADGGTRTTLAFNGEEVLTIVPLESELTPGCRVHVEGIRADNSTFCFNVICRLDTERELEYFAYGGILNYVLAGFMKNG